jgi:hypothetical protein
MNRDDHIRQIRAALSVSPENRRFQDSPDVHRLLRRIDQVHDRKCFEATGNGIYAFWAIGRYGPDEELPLWIREWLFKATEPILRALMSSTDPEKTNREMLNALGLVRDGRNATAALHQDIADDVLACMRFVLKVPAGELADDLNVNVAQIYKRTNRAHRRWPSIG